MTKEEFKTTKWTGQMKATYQGMELGVASVDFEEFTILLVDKSGKEFNIPCENCTLVESTKVK